MMLRRAEPDRGRVVVSHRPRERTDGTSRCGRFHSIQLVVPWLAMVGLLLFDGPRIEEGFSSLFYSSVTGRWPLSHNWLLDNVLHTGGKWTAGLIGVACLATFVASFAARDFRHLRRTALYLLLAMGTSTAVVGLWKAESPTPCPRDCVWFGGSLPYHEPFESLPPDVPGGHCFPGAHASVGFMLFAFYFAFRRSSFRTARAAFWAALFFGNLLGLAQVARGSHFLSHHLWTGFVSWEVCAVLHWLWFSDL